MENNNAIDVNLNVNLKANADLIEQMVNAQKEVIDFEMTKMTEVMNDLISKWMDTMKDLCGNM